MSRTAVVVAGISLTLLSIGTALGAPPVPLEYAVAETTGVHPGVSYRRMVKAKRPVTAHVAHIEAGAPVELRVISGHDKVPNRYAELETTGSMCRRTECLVAVNGDFMYQEQPVGGVVIGGRMLRSPDPNRPQLTIDGHGRLSAGGLPWTGSLILSNGTRIPLAGINVPPRDGVVLYTSDWGAGTSAPGRVEVVAATPTPAGVLNRPVRVELQERRTVPGPIPPGGAVLSASGSAAEALDRAWRDLQQKAITSRARLLVESPVKAAESLGANPVVLRGGARALPWPEDPNVVTAVHPRTLVGWNAAGDRFIVAVDGRQPSSAGLTIAEAADFLLGLGATDAVNLDGGGGTTFVVGGSLRNRPSDHPEQNPPPERVAPNALAVLPRPPDGAPAPAPVRPMAVGTPAEEADALPPPESGPEPGPSDGPSAHWRWLNESDPDAREAAPGQSEGQPESGFGPATKVDGAQNGRLIAQTSPAGVRESAAGRSTATSRRPASETRASDEAAGSPDAAAAGFLRPGDRPAALLEHAASRVAVALVVLHWGLLAAVVRRHRRPVA